MFRNRSVSAHQFSMIPSAQIPRSRFNMQTAHKTTFDSGYLIPIYVDEVLPGDHFKLNMTAFARLSTPIVPIMDNVYLESFFFFVPNRLVWSNWKKFMGEQINPGDSISYTIPTITSPISGYPINGIYDYMGLPTVGQVTVGQTVSHSALPLRCYNLIYNEWFRDENLQNSTTVSTGDGPDANSNYALLRRGKRHDYFTSCLPWTQKGTSAPVPLAGTAKVNALATEHTTTGTNVAPQWRKVTDNSFATNLQTHGFGTNGQSAVSTANAIGAATSIYPTNLYADLSSATATTINQLRQSFQIQRLLERDARGGTRYTEIVRAHFGVISPDARQQRPEYLGGGMTPVNIQPVPNTSGTGASGTTVPQGYLAATGQAVARNHGFSQAFTEHGYVVGLVSVRADLSYQQGMRRMWNRFTRYDFYFPVFAALGEQAVLNKEIYATGVVAQDDAVFGYQERWAEYRYNPSLITGLFRSTASGTLDVWHLSQKFTALPTLNSTFIQDTPPMARILATTPSTGKEFLLDCFFNIQATRPMPMYSVPGLIDHF